MASPLTSNFMKRAVALNASLVPLVKVEFQSGEIAYFSTTQITTPDGRMWEAAMHQCGSIIARGSPLSAGPDNVSGSFSLHSKRFVSALQATVENSFKAQQWLNATVSFYLWEMGLTSFSDVGPMLLNAVVDDYDLGPSLAHVKCVQRTDWDRSVPNNFVTRDRYPRAPTTSLGKPVPCIWGRIADPLSPPPWHDTSISPSMLDAINHVYGPNAAVPAVLVDTGRGGSGQSAKFALASHALKAVTVVDNGLLTWTLKNNGLQFLDPTARLTNPDTTGDTTLALEDDYELAYIGIPPSEVVTLANQCSEPRYIIDGDPASYALFDWDANKRDCELRLPSIPVPGTAKVYHLVIAYVSSASLTNFQIQLRRASTESAFASLTASTTPKVQHLGPSGAISWGTAPLPVNPWDFSESTLRIGWRSGTNTGQTCKVYLAGVYVRYGPNLILPVVRTIRDNRTILGRTMAGQAVESPNIVARVLETIGFPGFRLPRVAPDEVDTASVVAVTADGRADDGSGTYTGSANALIQRFPDVIRNLLEVYGGEGSSKITTAGSTHGSFVDARAALLTQFGKDMLAGLAVSETTNVREVAKTLCDSSLSWLYLSRFDDKWKLIPWKSGATGIDYDRKVYGQDLIEPPKCSTVKAKDLLAGVRVLYGWDGIGKSYSMEVAAHRDWSNGGQRFLSVRDQYLKVVTNVNDKVDLNSSSTDYTATLTAGTYTDDTFLTELRTRLNALGAADFSVGFGFRIVAGQNARLEFSDGSSRSVTLDPGLYTGEGLAAHVQTKMNSVSSNWVCTYSRTTRKFTFSRTGGGTASLQFQLNTDTPAAALGFTVEAYVFTGSSASSVVEVEEGRIVIAHSITFTLEWETGPNGINAGTVKTAADLMGFDARRDLTGAKVYSGIASKWYREGTLTTSTDNYGHKGEGVIRARAIYDPDTALELRNRRIDFSATPRPPVRFSSHRMFDLERGRRISFDVSVDSHSKYAKEGTDGSWAGKKIVPVEVHQQMGPTFIQEIVGIEV